MDDEYFMGLAIKESKEAPFPFGCVLVKDNHVVARGKSGETDNFDPTSHAEINAIRMACDNLHSKNLSGITLYSTWNPVQCVFLLLGGQILVELSLEFHSKNRQSFLVKKSLLVLIILMEKVAIKLK